MKVYLDDIREPYDGWVLVKTANAANYLLENNNVTEISLDHDLGDERLFGTGYDVIIWIEERVFTDENYIPPKIYIHTSNPSARNKMELCRKSIQKRVLQKNEI